ncbi:putative reverse transcriptase domain-containing protein [Tanacetum coccineum]|uniref:Reverse transcriptase domain-containing protein n=1 Tax=Tanacetum coccineum TaxID=301880 RepID=A0ABQ4Z9K5_9ASTR
MNMTLRLIIKDRILAAQKEASDESVGLQKGLDKMIELRSEGALYYLHRILDYKMDILARLYLNEIIARHRFTLRFWQLMQEALGTRLDMSTTYHPQTDGQSEHTIQTLEDMLRASSLDSAGRQKLEKVAPDLRKGYVDLEEEASIVSKSWMREFNKLKQSKLHRQGRWYSKGT